MTVGAFLGQGTVRRLVVGGADSHFVVAVKPDEP